MKPLRLQLLQNGRVLGEWSVEPGETVLQVVDPETGVVLGQVATSGLGTLPSPEVDEEPELTLPLEESTPSTADSASVAFAELWVRTSGGWQKQGVLRTGQKATYGQAKVRLRQGGELVVVSGSSLSGGAELPSGGDLAIESGSRPHCFPPGTSVILTDAKGHGFFVKSRLGDHGFREVVERTGQSPGDSSGYRPPLSDLESFSEDTRG